MKQFQRQQIKQDTQMLRTDLIAKTLRGNDSDLIADPLVGFKVECEFGVVALDNDLCGFLHSLWDFQQTS